MSNLELAWTLVLHEHIVHGVRIESHVVDRVLLAGTHEQILIDLAIGPAQGTVELPVREAPGVHKADGMRTDLIEKLHNRAGAGKGDLSDGSGTRGEEVGGFTLESMQGMQAEELVEGFAGGSVAEGGGSGRGGDGFVEVLHDEVLGVSSRQAPEVNQETVPRTLLNVTVLQCFESEIGRAPSESSDNVRVVVKYVESGTHITTFEEVLENAGCVVVCALTGKNSTRGFQELDFGQYK